MAEFGPQNGMVGESFGLDIPQSRVPEQELTEEKGKARFSKTKEFQQLKKYIEEKINFYQTQLPDGRALTAADAKERASLWVSANIVIGEFNMLLSQYEEAEKVVKEAEKNA